MPIFANNYEREWHRSASRTCASSTRAVLPQGQRQQVAPLLSVLLAASDLHRACRVTNPFTSENLRLFKQSSRGRWFFLRFIYRREGNLEWSRRNSLNHMPLTREVLVCIKKSITNCTMRTVIISLYVLVYHHFMDSCNKCLDTTLDWRRRAPDHTCEIHLFLRWIVIVTDTRTAPLTLRTLSLSTNMDTFTAEGWHCLYVLMQALPLLQCNHHALLFSTSHFGHWDWRGNTTEYLAVQDSM